jgi:hypothetical protein
MHALPSLADKRGGYSLLEVVMASTLTLSTLVPTLHLLRDGMVLSRQIDQRLLLANYAVNCLERQLATVSAIWSSGQLQGDFASDGHPHVRYAIVRSDHDAEGGITGRLMVIRVTTYFDSNGDDGLSPGELSTVFETKVSKLATYEAAAAL